MRTTRVFLLALLLALPALASAQDAPPIEQAMNAEEFRAAGLDKLSAEELARLNAWLDRRVAERAGAAVAAASEQAREEGRKEVIENNRGFFHFGKSEPIAASIVGEFRGFGRGRTYVLDNGQEWKQVDDASLAGARLTNPKARIKPGLMGNVWYMQVEGFNTAARVERIK